VINLEKLKNIETPWGSMGYLVGKRTYFRNDYDRSEEYFDVVNRVIMAANKQLKVGFTLQEQYRLAEILLKLKGTVAGRFFWQLGTKTVSRLGLASLQNCAFTKIDHPIEPFIWAMDMLMLGSGVGYSIQREHIYKLPPIKKRKIKIERLNANDADFIVPDKREGWTKLLGKVLKSYFYSGQGFTYSTKCIRGRGLPIKGFGGVSSGPEELVKGIENICGVLDNRRGKQLRPIDCLDIMNIIGSIVVAGNVRRSAQIAIGDYDDLDYLNAKNWDSGNIPNWRAMSNNSVVCNDINKLPDQFWDTYLGNSEPYGLINLKLSQEVGRTGETQYPDPEVAGYNPCVTGDTEILTDNGYYRIDSLVGKKVKVWNGFEFSKVEPKITGENQRILEVSFSNGRTLKCTPYHKFVLSRGYNGEEEKLEAKDLKLGDKLIKHNFPTLSQGKESNLTDMYTQGFYSADGVKNKNIIWLYKPKYNIEKYLNVRQIGKEYTNQVGVSRKNLAMNFDFKSKTYIPFELNIQGRLAWFSGLIDGDGVELKEGGLQLCSIDKEFLLDVQKLLTTCGISSKINLMRKAEKREMPDQMGGTNLYSCQKLYRMCVSAKSIQYLKKLGLSTKRLKFEKEPNRDASRFVQVTGIKELGIEDYVYCFTEPKRNLGCFNGIVTGQCAEQSLAPYETCCLAEIHLPNIESKDELKEVAEYLYRINKHSLALPCHHKQTEEIVHKNMRMGIGITGYCMATNKQKSWLRDTYTHLRKFDNEYSAKHGFPTSIKLTTVKPSGTLSLLSGVTPGCHPGYSHYHIRRVRISSESSLVQVCKQNGYPVEFAKNFDGTDDVNTSVVEFPCKFPRHTLVAEDCTAIDQLEIVKGLQKDWSDNAVSCTVYYKKDELPKIKRWLAKNFNKNIKSVSFLLHSEHGFVQAPLEEITKEEYDKRVKLVTPITDCIIKEEDISEDQIGCSSGACPIK